MKPIVIIAIAVGCSMVGVFAMLVVMDMYDQIEYQKAIDQYNRELYLQELEYAEQLRQQEFNAIAKSKFRDNLEQEMRNECREKWLGQLEEYYDCIKRTDIFN